MNTTPVRILAITCCILWLRCIGTENRPAGPPPSGITAAACDECHDSPGSSFCRKDSIIAAGTYYSRCYLCHLGSIALDSSADAATVIYHDKMLARDGRRFPMTDSLHTNNALSTVYAQCNACHQYPPTDSSHTDHVTLYGKKCYECHFATIGTDTVPDPPAGVIFLQREHAIPGGGSVPSVNGCAHISNFVEIGFRKKYEKPVTPDSVFIWNAGAKSCSNIECHSGPPAGASRELAFWKGGGR
jgi:predicted CxxxxCH...CXXCH cytochrome family protein